MKKIWFVQQQPFDFMPLKAGLGIITEDELERYSRYFTKFPMSDPPALCPKIYTTRTRRMSGEYQVVRGSRFKAKPLDPPIEFRVEESYEIDFTTSLLMIGSSALFPSYLNKEPHSFPELDLGIKGTTMKMLHDELLKLNKKATVDTSFYINKLKPIVKGGDKNTK
ncbi:MAG: hypothetical protein ACTSPB_07580 [Candidatus Thorarchaeota archaeon]